MLRISRLLNYKKLEIATFYCYIEKSYKLERYRDDFNSGSKGQLGTELRYLLDERNEEYVAVDCG